MKILGVIFNFVPFIVISDICFSQQVISTAGSSDSGTGIELSWTIGEPVTATARGSDFYLTQGFHQSQLVSAIFNQELGFNTGWNIMSVRVIPQNKNLLDIFQPLIDAGNLKKVMDESGNSLEDWGIFGGWQNNIGEINPAKGYKVKVNGNSTLVVSGSPVNHPFAIPLKTGWNIIGYPNEVDYNAMNVVQPLIDQGSLVKVQDESGNSIEDWGIFGGWTNNIGNFTSGEGYKIRLNASDTLWINESYPKSIAALSGLVATSHFVPQFPGNGVDHMNINLVNLSESGIMKGDEIGIFDGDICVGSAQVSNSVFQNAKLNSSISIPVSAADGIEGINGYSEGNQITLKLFRNGEEYHLSLLPLALGKNVFEKGESLFAKMDLATGAERLSGSNISEINCYPNPFSDEVNVEIKLATDTEIEVAVMNQLGQKIDILTDKKLFYNGTHNFRWNAKNASNQQISSGIYYIKIWMDNNIHFKKVIYYKAPR